jgi:uncharacterized membrane protein YfcA
LSIEVSPSMSIIHCVLAMACGSLVGFSLALIGAGGSILAMPLVLYVVGVRDAHVAIGTSALVVAACAYLNFILHARAGHVVWKVAVPFAAAGLLGAYAGSTLGKAYDSRRLLVLFALVMLVAAASLLRRRQIAAKPSPPALRMYSRVGVVGFLTGALSGFIGIGGGFLVVPGVIAASGMEMINAIGTSLLAVGTFGLTTATNYAVSGLVDWGVAAEFIGGGLLGGWAGAMSARRLAVTRGALNAIFAAVLVLVAIFMLFRSLRG